MWGRFMKKRVIATISVLICATGFFTSCGMKNKEVSNETQKIDIEKLEKDDKLENEIVDEQKENEVEKAQEQSNVENVEDETKKENSDLKNENALDNYFEKNKSYFISDKQDIKYTGYAEQGFVLNYNDYNKQKNEYVIDYSGKMDDGYGEDERGERKFKLEYYFHVDAKGTPMAYERIRNEDYMNPQKDNLVSIIKNYIVIWGDLENGDEWVQNVSIEGKKYTAKTIVSDVTEDSYKLNTVINDIEGYKDKRYTEQRTYEKNKGLVSLSCSVKGMDSDFSVGFNQVKN